MYHCQTSFFSWLDLHLQLACPWITHWHGRLDLPRPKPAQSWRRNRFRARCSVLTFMSTPKVKISQLCVVVFKNTLHENTSLCAFCEELLWSLFHQDACAVVSKFLRLTSLHVISPSIQVFSSMFLRSWTYRPALPGLHAAWNPSAPSWELWWTDDTNCHCDTLSFQMTCTTRDVYQSLCHGRHEMFSSLCHGQHEMLPSLCHWQIR